jgi:hypothetical protein
MSDDYIKQTSWLHLGNWLRLRENQLGEQEFSDLVRRWQDSVIHESITHGWVTQNSEYFESALKSWTTTGQIPDLELEIRRLLRITAAVLCDSLVANGGISHLYDDPISATAPEFARFLNEIGLTRYSRMVHESVLAVGEDNLTSAELRQDRLMTDEVWRVLDELDEQMQQPWAGSLFNRKCDGLLFEWMESAIHDAYQMQDKL